MRRKGEHLERVAAALCNLAPPLREQRHGAHDERRARVRRQGCARREDGAARVGRGARVLVCQHEGAHLHRLAEAHLLAEEAAGDDRQRLGPQLPRHRVVVEAVVGGRAAAVDAARVGGALLPEESVEAADVRLAVVHPLQRLPLELEERQLQPVRLLHLRVASALQGTHQAGESESVRARRPGRWLDPAGRRACGRERLRAALHGRRARPRDWAVRGHNPVHQLPDVKEAGALRAPGRDAHVEDVGLEPHVEPHADGRLAAAQAPRQRWLPLDVQERSRADAAVRAARPVLAAAGRARVERVAEPLHAVLELEASRPVLHLDLPRQGRLHLGQTADLVARTKLHVALPVVAVVARGRDGRRELEDDVPSAARRVRLAAKLEGPRLAEREVGRQLGGAREGLAVWRAPLGRSARVGLHALHVRLDVLPVVGRARRRPTRGRRRAGRRRSWRRRPRRRRAGRRRWPWQCGWRLVLVRREYDRVRKALGVLLGL